MDADNEDSVLFFSPPKICLEVLNNHSLDILSS